MNEEESIHYTEELKRETKELLRILLRFLLSILLFCAWGVVSFYLLLFFLFFAWSSAAFSFFCGVVIVMWLGVGILLAGWSFFSRRVRKAGAILLSIGLLGLILSIPVFMTSSPLANRF